MNGAEVLVPISMFFSIAAVLILRGPLGKAMADRISGRAAADDAARIADLTDAVQQLTGDVQALEDRLDFTERLLARQQDALRLKE